MAGTCHYRFPTPEREFPGGLIRASLRYASKKYWVPLSKDLRLIYTAADQAAAAAALETFAATWGDRYPAIIRLWRAH